MATNDFDVLSFFPTPGIRASLVYRRLDLRVGRRDLKSILELLSEDFLKITDFHRYVVLLTGRTDLTESVLRALDQIDPELWVRVGECVPQDLCEV